MAYEIKSVAAIGGGTMGRGIGAACAAAGRPVLILENDSASAQRARERALATAQSPEEAGQLGRLIDTGTVA